MNHRNDEEKKIRKKLQEKIRMKQQAKKQFIIDNNSQYSSIGQVEQDFMKNFESINWSYEKDQKLGKSQPQFEDNWAEVQKQNNQIIEVSSKIDQLRIQLIHINKEEQKINININEQKQKIQKQLSKQQKQHQEEIQLLKKNYQLKIEHHLQEIQKLIEQKGQFTRSYQKLVQEEKKMKKIQKDQQQKYKQEIKNNRQAFLVLQKQKSSKWQKIRKEQIKEQAIRQTEPKILAIIKSSNEDIKKTAKNQQQKFEQYQVQLKTELQKKFKNMKQKLFEQNQQEKEELRINENKKMKEKYHELENHFQKDKQKIRKQYNDKIRQLDFKLHQQIEEFINHNRNAHSESLKQMQQMRIKYELKIKDMQQNIKEKVKNKITKIQDNIINLHEKKFQQLRQTNEGKLQIAQQKIKKILDSKVIEIKNTINEQKQSFKIDIDRKYEGYFLEQTKKFENEIYSYKMIIEKIENKVINNEKNLHKNTTRIKQYTEDINIIRDKNYSLQQKLTQIQLQIEKSHHLKVQNQRITQKKCQQRQKEKKILFQELCRKVALKQQQRDNEQRQLMTQFEKQQQSLTEQTCEFKKKIQQLLMKKTNEVNRHKEQLQKIIGENQIMNKKLEAERKQLLE